MDRKLALNIRSKKLGVLLRDARLDAGASMKECGDLIGQTGRTISKYEDGEKSPSLPELEVLAFYLDIPLEQFWGKTTHSEDSPVDALGNIEQRLELRDLRIGALLRKTRKELDMSMTQVAEDLDITTYRLKSYEQGKFAVPIPELEALADMYELEMDDFFSDKGPIAAWSAEQRAVMDFVKLPPDLQAFASKPINKPYLEIARKLSELSVDELREVAESLLEITL